ncbi:hypothetical protein MMC13_003737 [Lambiella insularis]|nr:hypothetical protein [Lambiella insularis]
MAAQQYNAQPNDDVNDWINRVKDVVAKPETVTAPAPANATPWHERMLSFFDPIDTCAITCCCPGITFGKTHHRLRKDPNLREWSPINASCGMWYIVACFGCHVIPNVLQRHEIRQNYGLQGDVVTDCLRAWCCNCCDLIQQDKEAAYHTLNGTDKVVMQQPGKVADSMTYPA